MKKKRENGKNVGGSWKDVGEQSEQVSKDGSIM